MEKFDLIAVGKLSKKASFELNKTSEEKRNNALKEIANALRENKAYLIEE